MPEELAAVFYDNGWGTPEVEPAAVREKVAEAVEPTPEAEQALTDAGVGVPGKPDHPASQRETKATSVFEVGDHLGGGFFTLLKDGQTYIDGDSIVKIRSRAKAEAEALRLNEAQKS